MQEMSKNFEVLVLFYECIEKCVKFVYRDILYSCRKILRLLNFSFFGVLNLCKNYTEILKCRF